MSGTRTVREYVYAASIVLPAGCLVAFFVAAMLMTSGARLDARTILGLIYGATAISTAGYALVLLSHAEGSSTIALAILLGSIATSIVLTGGSFLTGYTAGTIFLWWSAAVFVVAFGTFQSAWRVKTPAARPLRKADAWDIASAAIICLVVGVWCRRAAGLLPTLQATGLVPIWRDYFIHATEIAQFGEPLGAGHGSFLLVDRPIVFYHYASYMLPAAVAPLVDLPALGLATSVLLPYGILTSALGVYALVRTIASPPVALLAPIALLVVPDASDVGLRNGFFGFRWMLLTVPGSGYGLGVACTALALMVIWRDGKRAASLWLGLIVTAALFQFRAHFFVLLAPALALTLVWETDYVRRHARSVTAALLAASVIGVLCITAVPVTRHAWLQFSAFGPFMETVHTAMSPTAYDGTYQMIGKEYGQSSAWVFGFVAIVPVALGALTIASPLALSLAVRRAGWQRFDSFPIWCVVLWLGIVVWAPQAAHGDPTEYQNRTVVLVYAVAFVWTLVWLDRAIERRAFILPTIIIAAVTAGATASWDDDLARPHFAWGSQFFGVKLDQGLFEAATFVRTHAVTGDTFALIPSDRTTRLDDAATRFAALANVPAYVARAGIQVLNGEERRALVEQRLATLNEIETTDSIDVAALKLRAIGVEFLVALGDRGPRFDPDRGRAAFRTGGAAVYRVGGLSTAR